MLGLLVLGACGHDDSIETTEVAVAATTTTQVVVYPSVPDGRVFEGQIAGALRDAAEAEARSKQVPAKPSRSKPTTPTTRPPKRPSAPSSTPSGVESDVWRALAVCESTMTNDPNAPYWGYFQFDLATWREVGGTGYPDEHSYEHQKQKAQQLQAKAGWGRWPRCSRKLGLR